MVTLPGIVTAPLESIVRRLTPPVTKDILSAEGLIRPVFGSPLNFKLQLDTDPKALLNCYKYNYECLENNVDVLLNIGLMNTTILVYGDNQELFTREIAIAGHHINLDFMQLKNINYKEAEDEKLNNGVNAFEAEEGDSDSESIKISQRNILSELSDEIRKTLRYYMKSKVGVSYNKFYISGGLSNMSGLVNFLNTSLNVEFDELNPFNKMDINQEIDNKSKYAVSFGLALREVDKD